MEKKTVRSGELRNAPFAVDEDSCLYNSGLTVPSHTDTPAQTISPVNSRVGPLKQADGQRRSDAFFRCFETPHIRTK